MKTTYKVLAVTGFNGHQQGDQFEADLDPGLERRALERGQLKKVTSKKPKEEEVDNG